MKIQFSSIRAANQSAWGDPATTRWFANHNRRQWKEELYGLNNDFDPSISFSLRLLCSIFPLSNWTSGFPSDFSLFISWKNKTRPSHPVDLIAKFSNWKFSKVNLIGGWRWIEKKQYFVGLLQGGRSHNLISIDVVSHALKQTSFVMTKRFYRQLAPGKRTKLISKFYQVEIDWICWTKKKEAFSELFKSFSLKLFYEIWKWKKLICSMFGRIFIAIKSFNFISEVREWNKLIKLTRTFRKWKLGPKALHWIHFPLYTSCFTRKCIWWSQPTFYLVCMTTCNT